MSEFDRGVSLEALLKFQSTADKRQRLLYKKLRHGILQNKSALSFFLPIYF